MANNSTNISKMNEKQIKFIIDELKPLDAKVDKKVRYVTLKASLYKGEALEYVINNDPILWAKVYLNWEARDYQKEILKQGKKSRRLVLRLGRRLGKTECICVLILWYAHTQINKGKNDNVYDILIITPFETQIDLIFKRLHEIIESSPIFKDSIDRDVYHRIEIANCSNIFGLTAGSKSSTGGNNTRGQHGDIIIFDEVDYTGSPQITNALNIANDDPGRVKIIAASTPSGKREEYYNWCINASRHYRPSDEDIKNFTFNGYSYEKNAEGNGWTEIYAPSNVNKEILKINPDTQRSYLADLKYELTELRFKQEVMAEFGEEENGVYQKRYIDIAIEEGRRINHKYTTEMTEEELQEFLDKPRSGPRILGVDWDSSSAAGPSLCCIELDKLFKDANGIVVPKFKVLFRVELAVTKFTYTDAVDKIIEMNDTYDFDWISVDKGYGQTQVEMLHKYGLKNPITGLHKKVVDFQFSEKIETRDPCTFVKDKKPIKPFMVNNSVIMFERQKVVFNPKDKKMIEQFEQYRIVGYSGTGVPIYSSDNDHILDAFNLALLIFQQKYSDLFKILITNKIFVIKGLTPEQKVKNIEAIQKNKKSNKAIPLIANYDKMNNSNRHIKETKTNSRKFGFNRTPNMPKRRMF